MPKYDALRDHLRRRTGEVRYTLAEISDLVPGGLPPSAYRYEAWWANGDGTHSHSRSWADAGFTAHPDLDRGTVRFVPMQGHAW
ncbi:DUF7662 domain-containing protein [Micromonospora costi]|uniref:DUF7662 domain-containing protein n=1 Tax=Micromonospora costi TaxID=1530042 RepID=UPI003BA844BC